MPTECRRTREVYTLEGGRGACARAQWLCSEAGEKLLELTGIACNGKYSSLVSQEGTY